MLPFLKQNKEGSMSAPVETARRKPDEDKEIDGLETAMEEFHNAIMAKRYKEAAEIFRSCFEFVDAQPHVEGPHE